MSSNWKLKLKYQKSKTAFKHFTILADGIVSELSEGFECPLGKAWMGMKIWANSEEDCISIATAISDQIGFKITGRIEIFKSEPEAPPGKLPHGYDINFTPYSDPE